MDTKKAFKFLGIEQTKDEEKISAAYRGLLPKHNPEDDAEGFKELRVAYETAISYAKKEDEEEKELTDIDAWLKKVESLYNTADGRSNTDSWRELLMDKVCTDLGEMTRTREKLLIFLSNHFRFSNGIWQEIDKTFQIRDDIEELKESFSEDYLNYICVCIERPMMVDYSQLEVTCLDEEDADIDNYLDYMLGFYDRMDNQDEDIKAFLNEMDGLAKYNVWHPLEDVVRLHICGKRLDEANLAKTQGKPVSEEEISAIKNYMSKYIDRLLELDADLNPYLRGNLAEALWWLGEKEEACRIYKEILEKYPSNWQSKVGMARHILSTGHPEEAYTELDDILQVTDGVPGIYTLLKQVNLACIKLYREQIENGIENEKHPGKEIFTELAWKLWQNDEPEEALKIVEQIEPDEEVRYSYENIYGRLLLSMKKYEEALPHLTAWSELLENLEGLSEKERKRRLVRRGMAYSGIATCNEEIGNEKLAEEYILKAIVSENERIDENADDYEPSDLIRYMFQYAGMLLKFKRYGECVEECEAIFRINREYYPAYLVHQEACYQLDMAQEVIDDYGMATNIYPGYYRPYYWAAREFYDYRQYDNALNIIERAKENNVEIEGRLALLRVSIKRTSFEVGTNGEEFRKLLDELDELEEKFSADKNDTDDFYSLAGIYCEKGLVYEGLQDYPGAIWWMNNAIKENPEKSYYHLILADILSDDNNNSRDFKESIIHYEKAIELGEADNSWIYYSLGYCYEVQERNQEAVVAYERAVELKKDYGTVYERLINLLLEMYDDSHKKAEAEKAALYAEKYVAEAGESGRTMWYLGKAYENGYQMEKAVSAYEKILKAEPENENILLKLGNCYRRLGRFDEAFEVLKKCISICEEREVSTSQEYKYLAMIYRSIGMAHESSGLQDKAASSYKTAISYYEKAIKDASYKDDIYEKMAKCYTFLKEHDKAIEILGKVEKESTSEALSEILWDMGDYQKAEEILVQEYNDAMNLENIDDKDYISTHLPDFYQESKMDQEKAISAATKWQEKTNRDIRKYVLAITKIRSAFIMCDLEFARKYALEAKALYDKIYGEPFDEYVMPAPYSAIFFGRAGWINAGLGNFEEAEKCFLQMDRVPVCNSCDYNGCYEFGLYIGILHMALGKTKEALSELGAALKCNPSSVFIKNLITKIENDKKSGELK